MFCYHNSYLIASLFPIGVSQAKKKHYDMELENLEKHQKQTIERMEADHTVKLKDETKRIKAEQEREFHKFQEDLKHQKKEVGVTSWNLLLSFIVYMYFLIYFTSLLLGVHVKTVFKVIKCSWNVASLGKTVCW